MGQTFAIQCIAQFAGSTAILTGHPGIYVVVGHPMFAGAALVFGDLHSPKLTSPLETPSPRRGLVLQNNTNSQKSSTIIFGKSHIAPLLDGFGMNHAPK
jgi:hypothetical protein